MVALESTGQDFLKTIPESDPTFQNRKKALAGLANDVALAATGCLVMLVDKDPKRTEDYKRLVAALRESIPGMLARTRDEFRDEFPRQIERMIADDGHKAIREELKQLLAAIASKNTKK